MVARSRCRSLLHLGFLGLLPHGARKVTVHFHFAGLVAFLNKVRSMLCQFRTTHIITALIWWLHFEFIERLVLKFGLLIVLGGHGWLVFTLLLAPSLGMLAHQVPMVHQTDTSLLQFFFLAVICFSANKLAFVDLGSANSSVDIRWVGREVHLIIEGVAASPHQSVKERLATGRLAGLAKTDLMVIGEEQFVW